MIKKKWTVLFHYIVGSLFIMIKVFYFTLNLGSVIDFSMTFSKYSVYLKSNHMSISANVF